MLQRKSFRTTSFQNTEVRRKMSKFEAADHEYYHVALLLWLGSRLTVFYRKDSNSTNVRSLSQILEVSDWQYCAF